MWKTWQAIWKRRRFESEMAEELAFHLEARTADLQRKGHPPAEAKRLARLELGSPENYKEECRQARGLRWLDELRGDLLYAFRGLSRNRAFTAVTLITLTLGIGANAAIFALVNAVLLKTLPVEKPEQLQSVYWVLPYGRPTFQNNASGSSNRDGNLRVADMFSYVHFKKLRDELPHEVELFAYSGIDRLTVTVNGQAQLARGLGVSWNYCRGLGLRLPLGRSFLPDDEKLDASTPPVLLSYDFWRTAFAARQSIIGETLLVGPTKTIVVGVLPPGFHGTQPGEGIDVLLPLTAWGADQRRDITSPRTWWVKMMARIPPPYPVPLLRSELETRFIAQLRSEPVPTPYDVPTIRLIDGSRGLAWLRDAFEEPLKLLMLVAGLILLMGAVNVAGLLLARAESRAAETASRLALGADRLRLIRQHLTESLLLGILGLLGGLCLAAVLQSALPSLLAREGEIPLIDITPDARFFGAALVATLGVAFLFGFYPAWKSSRLELTTALKRSPGPRAGRLPLGRTLTGIQVGLSLLLLIGAGTLVRTVLNLQSLNLGFKPERLLIFSADATLAGYKDEQALTYYARALETLAATPGVESVAFSRHGLLHASSSSGEFYYHDANSRLQHIEDAYIQGISPNYFHTVGVPLLAGRDLARLDDRKAKRVALVNQKMALLVRPDGASPIGLTLYQNDKGEEPVEIIGLVGDAKYDSLRDAAPATVYAPFGQRGIRQATFSLRTAANPLSIAPAIRRVMANVDPRVPIYGLRTEEEQIGIAMERERVLARLVTGFAALALLLAAIGIYGVLTYSVARRIPEIGVRLALGAAPERLRLMILRESLPPVAAGLAAGLIAAWWFTKLLEQFVFRVKPLDIWSVAGALILLIAGAAIAAWIPARRASLVTPMTALRYE